MVQASGAPIVADLKAVMRMNLKKDCKANAEDVSSAKRECGPDVGSLKVKSARSKPVRVMSNITKLPEELLSIQEDITLSMDGLKANGSKFSTNVGHDVHHIIAQGLVKNPNFEICNEKSKDIELLHGKGGFRLNDMHSDSEFKKTLK